MELFIAAFVFAVSTTVTPGPNNIMIMTSGLNHGIGKSLPHFLGICLGFPAMVAAIGFGLSTIFTKFPQIHLVIKILGVSYLLYLAWKIATTDTKTTNSEQSKPLTFLQAAVFQWVNPKAWVMAIGAIAAFTTINGEHSLQVLTIVLSFFLASFPCVGLWLFFGLSLKKLLKNPKQQTIFNITMAVLLVLSIIPMISTDISGSL